MKIQFKRFGEPLLMYLLTLHWISEKTRQNLIILIYSPLKQKTVMMTNETNTADVYEPNNAFGTEYYRPNFILVEKQPLADLSDDTPLSLFHIRVILIIISLIVACF